MTRPAIRDLIVPGSGRTVVHHWEYEVVTLRCGRCGNEFDAGAECKTTRCKNCGRVCRLDREAAPNVIPLRRPDRASASRLSGGVA